ncbi:hypothetical protein Mnod_0198 [Methylobacterium nodulans ORS 2060]|uniref:Uncharacterized protein n=1 Tax=Methylobacterium nodulans (strain LMG 21967 / CNCM I-2342 / ORS 2060) TaxID=460265 RepID=B8I9J0_METNO|nr:hypothetical protein Mnod_0198 [Methylobacterium nodulans ORS 2060]
MSIRILVADGEPPIRRLPRTDLPAPGTRRPQPGATTLTRLKRPPLSWMPFGGERSSPSRGPLP